MVEQLYVLHMYCIEILCVLWTDITFICVIRKCSYLLNSNLRVVLVFEYNKEPRHITLMGVWQMYTHYLNNDKWHKFMILWLLVHLNEKKIVTKHHIQSSTEVSWTILTWFLGVSMMSSIVSFFRSNPWNQNKHRSLSNV